MSGILLPYWHFAFFHHLAHKAKFIAVLPLGDRHQNQSDIFLNPAALMSKLCNARQCRGNKVTCG